MPIYSYACECGKAWDETRHVSERDEPAECTSCEAPAERRVTAHGGVQGSFGTPRRKSQAAFKDGEQLNFDFDKKD